MGRRMRSSSAAKIPSSVPRKPTTSFPTEKGAYSTWSSHHKTLNTNRRPSTVGQSPLKSFVKARSGFTPGLVLGWTLLLSEPCRSRRGSRCLVSNSRLLKRHMMLYPLCLVAPLFISVGIVVQLI
ncbi:hypothetical protein MPH_00874 [Macrophomina phaseolina MS6]|uniref:Uncharacterized protein n=1 Tax=Macrophomina phaseolina (strain MS6) TaxID=1126212 RepID=K2S4U9_MACPH|nr:hypothetical protein MPH_00874 [Macrophomina phaseolina MS6]